MERTDAFTKETRKMFEEEILRFPVEKLQDPKGGFYGRMTEDGRVDEAAPKEVILNARILWTYAAGYRVLKKKEYLMTATRTKDFFVEHFLDHKYGGVYWTLDSDGQRLDTGKRFRATGAAIYALSEYVLATGDASVLSYARNLFETTEKEGYDAEKGMYRDMKSRDWGDAEPQLKDERFNTHLFILEGYTNLYKVWRDETLRARIINLLTIMADKVLAGPCGEDEHSCRNVAEASWQMLKAAFAVRDIYVTNKVRPVVQELLGKVSGVDCGSRACVAAERIVADLWAWKYLNETEAADRALACWDTLKSAPLEHKCGNCIFRLGRMCTEVADMF